ncbi:MAG: DUF1957 domain-containing protein [Verrucomicrobiota bacterium]|nr:DUF1957 domain-containing protein [Verrucomicrobiota bacterium]
MRTGHLALILHAHLPFVRHPEHERFLEEDWLFEAITETYIPLVAMMQRLIRDGVPFKLTMSVTPPLAAMLRDPLLCERYVRHLEWLIDLAEREIVRTRGDERSHALAEFYQQQFRACRHRFVDEWQGDLLAQFRAMRDTGCLEIIGCAATHGLLPLLAQSPQAVRAQVLIGRDEYRAAFGDDPAGFWLPECAYSPDLDAVLQEANIRWFVVDAHGLLFGKPQPRHSVYAPCYIGSGPAAFARDRESSRQVWSAESGYPGDPAYRDFYRDIGFDLPLDYLGSGEVRKFTGLKYHGVTGGGREKEIYNVADAAVRAGQHATHYFDSRVAQMNELCALGFEPIVTIPFDAELFGHWWFEGPLFLESFIRKVALDATAFGLTTPSEFLASHPTQQTIAPAASSWGDEGYWEVWLNQTNAWIYPHLHAAAGRLTELATANQNRPTPQAHRVLQQLARELLLAQSSDWAFLMKSGTATQYATKRTQDHLLRFTQLYEQFTAATVDDRFLCDCEWRDNIFPDVNWSYYI